MSNPTNNNIINKNHSIYSNCSKDDLFVQQCIGVCLKSSEDRFWSFFENLEQLIVYNDLIIITNQADSLKFLYEETLMTLIDDDNLEVLSDVLIRLQKQNHDAYGSIQAALKKNSQILKSACRKDNIEVVKILVTYGCRLSISSLEEKMKQSFWSKYYKHVQMLLSDQDEEVKSSTDEVNGLQILRLMAKPSYILACYECAVDKTFSDDNHKPKIHFKGFNKKRSFHRLAIDKQMSIDICNCHHADSEIEFHYCPANPKFVPSLDCQDHLECNDPIFKCFDLAKMATIYAQHIPEYKDEYEEIANQCHEFSVQLLDECANTEEVQILLEESAGSSKYFRFTNEIKYPRLRLAIEHNHKEFVGHMFCQQMLREQWHGDVLWSGSPMIFKILHFLLLVMMAPIWVLIYIIVKVSKGNIFQNSKKLKRIYGIVTLETPLNRFCIFTGWYVLFLVSVIGTIEEKVNEAQHPEETKFRTGYTTLFIFTISMLWNDIQTIFSLVYIRTYFKFWRVFDFILHILLLLALIIKFIRTSFYSYNQLERCFMNSYLPYNITINNCSMYLDGKCQKLCERRFLTYDWEGVLLGIAVTLSIIRVIYWLQLQEKMGPLVINISRVILSIFSVLITYILVLLAFTAGLVFIVQSEDFDHQKLDNANLFTSFPTTMYILLWKILDPGSEQIEDLNIDQESIRGITATVLFVLYQLMIVIVILNLLIALMNATIQKVNDHKQLYWKFVRTSIWLEYFDDLNDLPIPFSILNMPIGLHNIIVYIIKIFQVKYKNGNGPISRSNSMNLSKNDICIFNESQMYNRKKHTKLMLELLQRYNWDLQAEKANLKRDNFRRQSMKMKIFKRNSEK